MTQQTSFRALFTIILLAAIPVTSSQAISLYSTLTQTLYMDCVRHWSGTGPAYRVDMKLTSQGKSADKTAKDRPTPQVLIISRIVEMTHTDLCQLGVDPYYEVYGEGISLAIPQFDVYDNGGNHAGTYSALLAGNANLDFYIADLLHLEQAQIISEQRPLVTVQNITPRVTQGTNGNDIRFADIGLELQVTPTIRPDDNIILEIQIAYAGTPPAPENLITTTVTAFNDTTMVVSGRGAIVHQAGDYTGVPVLTEIPLLGYLFKHNKSEESKKNLVIMVTSEIINNPASPWVQ